MKEKLIKIKDKILDAIFPDDITCIICGRDIAEGHICNSCQNSDIFNNKNRCVVCDTPIKEGNKICDFCKNKKKIVKSVSCPLLYNNTTRKSILKLKSDGGKYLAKYMAELIYKRLQDDDIDFDIIVPVPSHKKTIAKRGYNPAKVLADELSALTDKAVVDCLIKTVHTKNQKFLDFQTRQSNLENSITITDSKIVKDKIVLIVDDIITTGATIETCAHLMHKAKGIHACAVARRTI